MTRVNLSMELVDRALQLVDVLECQAHEVGVMGREAAAQRLPQLGSLGAQTAPGPTR